MSTSSHVSGKEEAISSNLVISILVFMSVVLGFTSCLFVLRLRGHGHGDPDVLAGPIVIAAVVVFIQVRKLRSFLRCLGS